MDSALDDTARNNVWQNPNGDRNVPYLDEWNGKRKLNLNWFDNRWNDHCRFLAVRSSFSFFQLSLRSWADFLYIAYTIPQAFSPLLEELPIFG